MSVRYYLRLSIAVALATIALKSAAWWLTDSVSLLSDALESLVNLAGAVFALAMVTVARRPPDEDHPYGHHKAEYFSSGFEGALIFVAAVGIVWAAVERFLHPQALEAVGLGIGLSVLSSVFNGLLARGMSRQARLHRSIALEADARHLVTDVWTTAGVIAGLLLATVTGWQWVDPAVAIAVALNIVREGGSLMWRSAEGLMDTALEPEVQRDIEAVLDRFRHDEVRLDDVSTRRAGRRRFVDLHLHVPADWTMGHAAAVRGAVERALMDAVPGLRATIQLLPMDVELRFEDPPEL